MKRNSVLIVAVLTAARFTSFASAGEFELVPGNLYGVFDGGIKQFDADLTTIATLLLDLPGARVVEGIAVNPAGNLVVSAFKGIGPTHHVLEIDGSGAIVNELDLGFGGLDRAAHLDVDAAGRMYVASRAGVMEIRPDFSGFAALPFQFDRSSGVTVGPDDRVYVTDSQTGQLLIFGPERAFERMLQLGGLRTGLDFSAGGELFSTRFSNGQGSVDMVDLVTGGLKTVVPLSTSAIAFAPDGTYYLSVSTGARLEHRSASHQILHERNLPGFRSDSIVVYVPEPASIVLLAGVLLCSIRQR